MRLDMYAYQGRSHVLFHSLRKQDALVSDPKGQLNLFAICRVLDCVSLSLSHADCVGVLIGQSAVYLWGGQCDWQVQGHQADYGTRFKNI